MIYDLPAADERIDQGDVINGCHVVEVVQPPGGVSVEPMRVIVLTQTCDLEQGKTAGTAVVAFARDAQAVVDDGILKPSDIRGPLRAGRIWGLYFLPADPAPLLPEMVADLRRLHTVRLDLLAGLCRAGQWRGRVRPLYREHLSQHFAAGYSRIGLPRPVPSA